MNSELSKYSFDESQDSFFSHKVKSFEECNNLLQDGPEVSLLEYVELVRDVSYEQDYLSFIKMEEMRWMNTVVEYFVMTSEYHSRAFKIQLGMLKPIGFDVDDYAGRTPLKIRRIMNRHDTQLKKELRMLKKFKLVNNVDYMIMICDIDGEMVETGYNITRLALYRIVLKKYGIRFLEAVLARMTQILYHYDRYKTQYYTSKVLGLQQSINNVKGDLDRLIEEKTKMDNFQAAMGMVSSRCSYEFRDSTCSYIGSDIILDSQQYGDEITGIHDTMNDFINRVEQRMTDVNLQLSTITNKIDDLVESIAIVKDSTISSIDIPSSIYTHSEHDNSPIFAHVRNVFNKYSNV